MRVVRYHEYGDPGVLQIDTIDVPEPDDGEIRVEVRAAGVNPVDTYFRDGSYDTPSLPMIPGVDVAGVVDEIGSSESPFEVGDRVFGTGLGNEYTGSTAEYVVTPTDRVAPLPEDVSFETAGAAGVAAVTPWRALVDHAALEPGEYAFIHGGSGGVGHVGVQIAAGLGSRVVTTARPEYHDQLSSLGADEVLDYRQEDLEEAVLEATQGGPDVIVDHMLERYLQFDCDVAVPYARIVLYRNRHRKACFTDVPAAGGKELDFTLMSAYNTPRLADPLTRIGRLLSDGWLDVTVAESYALEDAAAAHRHVREESFVGKLVITP